MNPRQSNPKGKTDYDQERYYLLRVCGGPPSRREFESKRKNEEVVYMIDFWFVEWTLPQLDTVANWATITLGAVAIVFAVNNYLWLVLSELRARQVIRST